MPEIHQDPATNSLSELLRTLSDHRYAQPKAGRDATWQLSSVTHGYNLNLRGTLPLSATDLPMARLLLENPPTGTLVTRSAQPVSSIGVQTPQSYREQVSLITRFIGLGKSQIATLFGVARQTLYDWLKGNITPTGRNAERIALLARAMAPACNGLKRPLFQGFITNPPNRSEVSIVELLEQAAWDEHDLAVAFQTARRLTDQRARELHLGDWTVSRAVGEDNLLDNSIALDLE